MHHAPTTAPSHQLHRGPRQRLACHAASLVATTMLILGILAALRTGLSETEQLAIFQSSPEIAVLWLAIGLVGVPMATAPRAARLALLVTGPVLLVLGLIGLVGDAESGLLIGDTPTAILHLVAAAICLGVGLLPLGAERAEVPAVGPPDEDAPAAGAPAPD